MKQHSSRLDYELEVRNWRQGYSPISMRDITLFEHKITAAIRRLPYLQNLRAVRTDDTHLVFRIMLKDVGSNADGVFKDFTNVLNSGVVGNKVALSVYSPTADGFEYSLALLDDEKNYFLAALQVSYNK